MSEVTQDHLMTDHPMTDPPMPMTDPPMPMTEPPMPMTEPPAMEIDQKPPVEEQREEPGAPKAPPPETGAGAPAVRSIEGWIVLVTNVHEEASEEDLQERFGEYGDIQNLHLNLDRRTGYVKGYALIEYSTLAEAREAIAQTDNTKLLDQTIYTDYAFVRPPPVHNNANRGGGRASGGYNKRGGRGSGDRGGRSSARSRSRSPVAAKEDDAEEPTPIILESLGDQVG